MSQPTAQTSGKMFPIQDGSSIPWSEAEKAYELYCCLFGTDQSLTRIAQRGGFGEGEIDYIRKTHEEAKAKGNCFCGKMKLNL